MALAKLEKIPDFSHTLTEQEMSMLSAGQQALAKDWSINNQRSQWMAGQILEMRNALVDTIAVQSDHAKQLDIQKVILRIVVYFIPSAAGFVAGIYGIIKFVKFLWKSP